MEKYFHKLKFGRRMYFPTVCGKEFVFTLPESHVPVSEYSFTQLLRSKDTRMFICAYKEVSQGGA